MNARFGPWRHLVAAEASAPPAAGLFQVRVRHGLLRYPAGRSAMLYYGRDQHLDRGIAAFRARVAPRLEWRLDELLVRWMPACQPLDEELARHLARFMARFGAPPLVNQRGASGPASSLDPR